MSASVLGPSCKLVGEIRGSGSLECNGSVDGTISVDGDIMIGEKGSAKANLSGNHVVINGRLTGNAVGTAKVEVGTSGQVTGDIRAPSVAFGDGAFFEGTVEMRAANRSESEAD